MKKLSVVFAMFLFLISGVFAQVKNLVVDGGVSRSYLSGVYTYQGNFNNKPYWLGPGSFNSFVISFSKFQSRWQLEEWQFDTMFMGKFDIVNSTSTDAYPTSGWNEIKVAKEGPALQFSSEQFNESRSNDGSLNERITISFNKLDGYAFAGATGADLIASNAIGIDRIPSGLTAQAMLLSDSTIELYFTGNE